MAVLVAALVLLLWILVLTPVRAGHVPRTEQSVMSRAKQHALALMMYAADHDDSLPPAAKWMDDSWAYVGRWDAYRDPTVEGLRDNQFGFSFFEPVEGAWMRGREEVGDVPLTFQSTELRKNANGLLDTLPYRLKDRNVVSFLDGHAESKRRDWRYDVIVVER